MNQAGPRSPKRPNNFQNWASIVIRGSVMNSPIPNTQFWARSFCSARTKLPTARPAVSRSQSFPPKHHSPPLPSPTFLSYALPAQTSLQTLTELLLPQKYTYPDPTPEFAEAETHEFRDEILKKLSKDKETFGDERDTVNEVFNNFLHKEYGGPGTLLVEPFTDMLIAPKERKLTAGP
ncbi:hypothetical protein CUMW_022150 [Citrus unshiu]|nr:hypothetical protein CUMW_022150 [Citrus unshiu]